MPPIATSSSCSTLVDVDHHDDKLLSLSSTSQPPLTLDCAAPYQQEFVETRLLLPARDDSDASAEFDYEDDDDECSDYWFEPTYDDGAPSTPHSSSAKQQQQQQRARLSIPSATSSTPLDMHLSTIPTIVEKSEELQSTPTQLLSTQTLPPNTRIINIGQGELGHVTSRQADLIVSDGATTCHIVAIRSVRSTSTSAANDGSGGSGGGQQQPQKEEEAMVSLCHVDRAGYDDCLRDAVMMHKAHHNDASAISMDLHIIGGYSDANNSSLDITTHVLNLFAQIASEEESQIELTLQTCSVGCLNDDGFGSPIGRGLAVNVHSGEVFLAAVDDSLVGPAMDLRRARLWTGPPPSDDVDGDGDAQRRLSVVHAPSADTDDIVYTIEPFRFAAFRDLDAILSLPDEIMLRYTSTSPDVEDAEQFCNHVRSTLMFMRDNDAEEIFGIDCSDAVRYKRSSGSSSLTVNEWVAVY